jgi:glycogen debranching enzyme
MIPSTGKRNPYYSENGDYWAGGVWIPTNTMVTWGLYKYGYDDLSYEIIMNHYDHMFRTWQRDSTVYENYWQNGIGPCPTGGSMKGMAGWSAITPISTFIERIIGIMVDCPANKVMWRIRWTEQHGLRNLKYGKGWGRKFDMVADARASASAPVTIRVNSNHAFTLEADAGFTKKTFNVGVGDGQVFTVQ